MPARTRVPRFDPTAVEFPTDRITIAQMRRREPRLFAYDAIMQTEARGVESIAAYCLELTLAEKAYCLALGKPDPHPATDARDLIGPLNDVYTRYGISAGVQQTRLLVREIEAAAVRQAARCCGARR